MPTDQVHLIQKYIGSEGDVPRLSKMNGTAWKKAKAKAKASVENIAKDLINLYAERKMVKVLHLLQIRHGKKNLKMLFLMKKLLTN